MIKKTIKYNDYNEVEREETFMFNLSKAELMEMELSIHGGLAEMITNIVESDNVPEIVKIFKKLILQSYGEKSQDGKRFRKTDDNGISLGVAFSETEAYSILFTELSTDAKAAAEFVNGIVPVKIDKSDLKVVNNAE